MNKERLYCLLIELTNRKWLSLIIKKYTQSKWSRCVIPFYQRYFQIDLSDFYCPQNGYQSLHDFFIRDIKEGVRPIASDIGTVVSPVDGIIEDFGRIDKNHYIYAKEKPYALTDLLQTSDGIHKFIGGFYIVIYLSPSHYHKIHCPVDGRIVRSQTLGSKSYSVNHWGLKYGKTPLSHNYRVVTQIQSDSNHSIILAKIGAMFINTITVTNTKMQMKKGEELGYFSFGSTIILLFEAESFSASSTIYQGKSVEMGQALGIVQN